jgi:alkyl hydroperoxide reductase subunit AhpF
VSSPVPYWLATPTPLHASGRRLPQKVDVAVIGGGLTGLSASLHLAGKVKDQIT